MEILFCLDVKIKKKRSGMSWVVYAFLDTMTSKYEAIVVNDMIELYRSWVIHINYPKALKGIQMKQDHI